MMEVKRPLDEEALEHAFVTVLKDNEHSHKKKTAIRTEDLADKLILAGFNGERKQVAIALSQIANTGNWRRYAKYVGGDHLHPWNNLEWGVPE